MKPREDITAGPVSLADFPGIPFEYIEVLRYSGITGTGDLMTACRDHVEKRALSLATGIPEERISELLALSELSTVPGIGGSFARILYEAGAGTLEQLAAFPAGKLHNSCRELIRKRGYTIEPPSENEVAGWIEQAKVIRGK